MSIQAGDDAPLPWPRPALAWYAVGVLSCVYIVSFVDRQILSLLVAPLKRDLALSDVDISILQGLSFSLFYSTLALPLGRLADLGSRRRLIAAGMLVWCSMTVACGLAQTYDQLFVARMGVGIGEAALTPAALSIISDYFPPRRLPLAITVYSAAIAIGSGVAYIGGGSVVAYAAAMPRTALPLIGVVRPWQLAFVVVGAAGLLLLPVLLTVREPRRRRARAEESTAPSIAEVGRHLRGHRNFYGAHVVGFSSLMIYAYATLSWTPTLMQRAHGFDARTTGLIYGTILMTAGVAGPLTAAFVCLRLRAQGSRDATLRVATFGAALALPLALLWPTVAPAALGIALLAMGNFFISMPQTGLATTALQEVTPNAMRAQVTSLYFFIANTSGLIVGPTSVALLTDRVYGSEQAIGWSLATIAAITIPVALIALWRATIAIRTMQPVGAVASRPGLSPAVPTGSAHVT